MAHVCRPINLEAAAAAETRLSERGCRVEGASTLAEIWFSASLATGTISPELEEESARTQLTFQQSISSSI